MLPAVDLFLSLSHGCDIDLVLAHDVSDEARDSSGRWTVGQTVMYNGEEHTVVASGFADKRGPNKGRIKYALNNSTGGYGGIHLPEELSEVPTKPAPVSKAKSTALDERKNQKTVNPSAVQLTDNEYESIDAWFRTQDDDRRVWYKNMESGKPSGVCADFLSALQKMPPYRGTVYRGMILDSDEAYRKLGWKVGGEIVMNHPTSTSKNVDAAAKFLGGDPNEDLGDEPNASVLFRIKMKSGADISSYTDRYASEAEVVARPKSTYRITRIKHGTNSEVSYKVHTIDLEEV